MQTSWKVGELASQTGLTVRTLHHYDEIGLLKPSEYTASGHRLYREEDIVESFTGGNPDIEKSLSNMVQSEYSTMEQNFGFPDARLFEYIGKAMEN